MFYIYYIIGLFTLFLQAMLGRRIFPDVKPPEDQNTIDALIETAFTELSLYYPEPFLSQMKLLVSQ